MTKSAMRHAWRRTCSSEVQAAGERAKLRHIHRCRRSWQRVLPRIAMNCCTSRRLRRRHSPRLSSTCSGTYPNVFAIGQGLWSPWYVGNSMTDLDKKFGRRAGHRYAGFGARLHRRRRRRLAVRLSPDRRPSAHGLHAAGRRSDREPGSQVVAHARRPGFARRHRSAPSSTAVGSRARSIPRRCTPGSRIFLGCAWSCRLRRRDARDLLIASRAVRRPGPVHR